MEDKLESLVVEMMEAILFRELQGIGADFSLQPGGQAEPMDIAKLAMAIEERWNLQLWDEQVAQWQSLRDAAAHVRRMLEDGQDQPLERSDEERMDWYYE